LTVPASFVAALGLLCAASAGAAAKEVAVDCDSGTTIAWGLGKLDPAGPSTLRISGTCQENVLIRGFSDLRLVGSGGAELYAAPGGPGVDNRRAMFVMEALESNLVTIKGLTIHVADAAIGIVFEGCRQCVVRNCRFESDGAGTALTIAHSSDVRVYGVRVRGLQGSWTSDGSSLYVEGSDFDGENASWAGIMTGPGGVVAVEGSRFRRYGAGIHATGGSVVQVRPWTTFDRGPSAPTTIEENTCGGVWVDTRASFTILRPASVRVANNGPECWASGVLVGSGAMASLSAIEVTGSTGMGISVSGQSLVTLGPDVRVTGNNGGGLIVSYDSLAMGPPAWDPSTTGDVTIVGNQGNQGYPDLACDGSSRITGRGHFTGTPIVDCANFEP
jgi:hypothetical protein